MSEDGRYFVIEGVGRGADAHLHVMTSETKARRICRGALADLEMIAEGMNRNRAAGVHVAPPVEPPREMPANPHLPLEYEALVREGLLRLGLNPAEVDARIARERDRAKDLGERESDLVSVADLDGRDEPAELHAEHRPEDPEPEGRVEYSGGPGSVGVEGKRRKGGPTSPPRTMPAALLDSAGRFGLGFTGSVRGTSSNG